MKTSGPSWRFTFTASTTALIVITSGCNPLKRSRLSRECVWRASLNPDHQSGHRALFVQRPCFKTLASGNKCCYFTLFRSLSLFMSPAGRPSNHLLPISRTWRGSVIHRAPRVIVCTPSCPPCELMLEDDRRNNSMLSQGKLSPSKFSPKPKYLTGNTNSPTLTHPRRELDAKSCICGHQLMQD